MTDGAPASNGRWRLVQAHFLGALDAADRDGLAGGAAQSAAAAYASAQCGSDQLLLRDVLGLLAAHFGDGPVPRRTDDDATHGAELRVGDAIADFRIAGRLGVGGMGVVYLAERERDGFVQRVALKVLRADATNPQLIARLAAERRILARLEHPGIARLIDGGATADGRQYLAMEYVEGLTLMEHCTRAQLGLDARLRLFVEICETVHFAHQQLVVHRDLKPTNVMVTASGRTRLLDFGIAKVLEDAAQRMVEGEAHTMPWFTPAYAAPEQLRGEPASTLTDVYQLGLMLYELLAGARPFDTDGLPPLELRRVVCEESPLPPSHRLRTAEQPWTPRRLSGELDAIVLRALAKPPSQRYASAQQLSSDVRRYLDRLPVSAMAASRGAGYRAAKFVQRHTAFVAMSALAVVALTAGAIATATQARSASQARDEARTALAREERARDRAREEAAYLLELFGPDSGGSRERRGGSAGDPSQGGALSVLERGVERALALPDELQRAHRLEVLGRAYESFGAFGRAEQLLRESLALRRANLEEPHEDVAAAQAALGVVLRRAGQYVEAESLLVAALRTREQLLGPRHPEVAQALSALSTVALLRGRGKEAITLQERALDIHVATLGSDHPEVVSSRERLGSLHRAVGHREEAEHIYREVLASRRASYPGRHPLVANALLQLAQVVHSSGGRLDEAEPLYQEALTMQRELFGERHPNTVWGIHALAQLHASRGELAQALALVHDARAIREEALGARHPLIADCLWLEAVLLRNAGDLPQSAHAFRQVLERQIEAFGEAHLSVASTQAALGAVLLRLDDLAGAEALIRESLRTRRALLPATDPLVAAAESLYLRVAHRRVAGR